MNDFLGGVNSFFSSNPALMQLANNAVSNLTSKPKSAPKLVVSQPAVQSVVTPSAGMSPGMMIGIGVAVVAVAVGMIMIFKRK